MNIFFVVNFYEDTYAVFNPNLYRSKAWIETLCFKIQYDSLLLQYATLSNEDIIVAGM